MVRKRKADYSPEEWEAKKEANRERNRRYLAKNDTDVKDRRRMATKVYRERLKTNPEYTERAKELSRRAVLRSAKWAKENPEKVKENSKKQRQLHPEKEVAKVQRRNALKIKAIPSWANMDAIKRHYANARYLTEVTGCLHHVDHIIPLRGKLVCGLHVENNLRVIPHFLNTRKGNKFDVE